MLPTACDVVGWWPSSVLRGMTLIDDSGATGMRKLHTLGGLVMVCILVVESNQNYKQSEANSKHRKAKIINEQTSSLW